MKNLKNYIASISIAISLILIFSFFITILNYFDILSTNMYKGLVVITMIFSIFIGSYKLGLKQIKNGYLQGIYYGIVLSIILFLIGLIAKEKIETSNIIYYIIIIITSLIGGSIGINKKTTEYNQ